MADNLRIFGNTYNNAVGVKMTDTNGSVVTYMPLEPEPLDVNFIDYDGTLLYSYTAQEFLTFTAMPDNPSHDGLIAQGWNWTLSDAKSYTQKYGALVVGQLYTTDDGCTRFYISVDDRLSLEFSVRIQASVNSGVTIDWGDGSTTITTGTSATQYDHIYEDVGDYIVSLKANSGTVTLIGSWGSKNAFGNGDVYADLSSANKVYKVEMGENAIIGSYAFQKAFNVETITVATDTVFNNSDYAFDRADALKCFIYNSNATSGAIMNNKDKLEWISFSNTITTLQQSVRTGLSIVTVPESVTTLPNRAFGDSQSLRRLIIPDSVTVLPQSIVDNSHRLKEFIFRDTVTEIGKQCLIRSSAIWTITFPANVTTMGASILGENTTIKEVHMKPTTPPTLEGALLYAAATPVIYVPYSADHSVLTAYKEATNWSTYADMMVEETT